MHDRSIKLRYGKNLVTKHSTFSYPSCDYIINKELKNVNAKRGKLQALLKKERKEDTKNK